MPYTNKGFTGNDGSEGAGWDPLEVQHFKDIENCLVGDTISGVKDTDGHKHSTLYGLDGSVMLQTDESGTPHLVAVPEGVGFKVGGAVQNTKSTTLQQAVIFDGTKIDSGTGSTDTVDLNIYNSYSWRPGGSGTTGRTLTLSNAVDGMLFRVINASSCANLLAGGNSLLPGTAIILTHDDGNWYKI